MASGVRSRLTGMPIHAASLSGVKSISPQQAAVMYDSNTPSNIGTMRIMPRPHIEAQMVVAMATMASIQLVWQLVMAEPVSVRPMAITIGPVTTGGKKRSIRFTPYTLMRAAITK